MKKALRSLKLHKLILLSLFLGGLLGAFDAGLFTQTVSGIPPSECPSSVMCDPIGCSYGPGDVYCVYNNSHCYTNIPCPDDAL